MKNTIKTAFLALTLLFSWSCSDLQEQVLDESLSGGASASSLIASSVAPAYGLLPEFFKHTVYFAVQEISTDEAILPYRGGRDWGDNGIYLELHQHTYTPNHSNIKQCWDNLTLLFSRTVSAIKTLETISEADAKVYLAEMRGLRAYYNMVALDLWGIAFKKEDPSVQSEILRGSEALDYIRSEFEAVAGSLRTDVGPGRISQQAVNGLLARLYLNAAVYRDPYATSFNFSTTDLDKVIEYTSKVINSG